MSLPTHTARTIFVWGGVEVRTIRTFGVDGVQLQLIIAEICFEGHEIHQFSSHIFNRTVDSIPSAAWKRCTGCAPAGNASSQIFVAAFQTRDVQLIYGTSPDACEKCRSEEIKEYSITVRWKVSITPRVTTRYHPAGLFSYVISSWPGLIKQGA